MVGYFARCIMCTIYYFNANQFCFKFVNILCSFVFIIGWFTINIRLCHTAPKIALVECSRFQFQCHSGECIAVYNACDGIPQCVDGSDEGPEVLYKNHIHTHHHSLHINNL